MDQMLYRAFTSVSYAEGNVGNITQATVDILATADVAREVAKMVAINKVIANHDKARIISVEVLYCVPYTYVKK